MLRPLSLDFGLAVATARAAYRRAWLAPLNAVLLDSQAPRQTRYSTPRFGAGKIALRGRTDLCLVDWPGTLESAPLSAVAKLHIIPLIRGRMVYAVSLGSRLVPS